MTILFLLLGFIILVKGADVLVEGASALAKKLRISDLVIGLTVVAFGTSAPELFVSLFASIKGNSAIAIGNVIGSNLFNTLLILGISSLIFPLTVTKSTVWKEIPLSMLAAILLGIIVNDPLIDGEPLSVLSRIDGLVLLSFFVIFMYYTFGIAREIPPDTPVSTPFGINKSIVMILIGISGLIIGGKWVVESASQIAKNLGVSQAMIGLTIVAIGTSLPELVTSIVATWKKKYDLSIGNVVGSNIFNIFLVLGASSVITPLSFETRLNTDVLLLIISHLLLFLFMFTGKRKKLDRWEGGVFLLSYIIYTILMLKRG